MFDLVQTWAKPAKDEIKDGTQIGEETTSGIPEEKYNISTLYDYEGYMEEEIIDISAYAGISENIRVRFRLQSDEYLNFQGLYIDDVNVSASDETLFFDDMETGENGWIHSGDGDEWELGIH